VKIEYLDPTQLIPYVNNPRRHPEAQIRKLMGSIKEFGFLLPVLVDKDGVIIKGHGIIMAAIRLGVKEVPCLRNENLSDGQRKAYVIADNRLAEDSSWDKEELANEMLTLRDDYGFDLALTGFENREVLSLHLDDIGGQTPEDEVPKIEKSAVSQPGDLWHLGDHRIICGDCTSEKTVTALLEGTRPHLMVTDPPYGVKYNPDWRNEAGKVTERTGVVLNDDRDDWREAWQLFPGDVAYVWHGSLHGLAVAASLEANHFQLRSQIVWAKPHLILSRGDIHWQHEVCWYAVRKDDTPCPELPSYCDDDYEACWYAVREREISHWQGSRRVSSLWDIDYSDANENEKTTHGTQKPVECMRRPMLNNSKVNEYVYEPFSGSGTTLIAAQSCRRRCLAIELNPLYVDMAIRRWQHFTSMSAILDSNGLTFDKLEHSSRAG